MKKYKMTRMENFSYEMQKFKDFKEKSSLCMCVWALFLCQSTTKHKMLMSSVGKKNIIHTEWKQSLRNENVAETKIKHPFQKNTVEKYCR